jgi:hypothetical protein
MRTTNAKFFLIFDKIDPEIKNVWHLNNIFSILISTLKFEIN